MKNRHSWILKKAAALLIALTLMMSALPAAMAVAPDWSDLKITVSWIDAATGEAVYADAAPVYDAEGNFWIMISPEAPLDGLTIFVTHPNGTYQISPAAGEALGYVTVVGDTMDRAFAKATVPTGVHWYNWHQIPFDNSYPEYFPEKPGMKEVVSWMKSKGVLVMPYINARLWDQDIPSFSNAVPAACKKEDGRSFYVERYGSGRNLVPMCPVTKLWRDRVGSICERLINEIGVNAIYLDQVAAAHPAACHDRTHGHPLGGGAYWTEGYRELMKPIRDLAVRKGGVALTTECTAEPYTDSFDAYLAWFARSAEDIPFLPAVYSGYTVYFSSPQDSHDSLDSFCAMQGRDFLWGCQLGWNPPWILDTAHEGHRAFTVRLCRERLAHKQFFLEGELMGELPTPPGFPTVEVNWHRKPSVSCRMPAVMGTVWRDAEGKRSCVCLVNVSGEEQTFPYRLNGTDGRATLPPRSVKTIEAAGNVAKREPF